MTNNRRVLVVAPDPAVADTVLGWLASAGHDAWLLADFEAAKPALDERPPDLLITEVKLGDYNGLHLAIRARRRQPGTPTIVIGEPSRALESEAGHQQARYLAQPLIEQTFTAATREMLGGTVSEA